MDEQRRGGPWTATESTEGLRIILDAAAICLWEWDLATGTLRSSANFAGIYGYDPSSFGETFEGYLDVCIHPSDRGPLTEWFERGRRGESGYRLEFRAILADGSIRWLEHSGRVRFDDASQPVVLLGATVDVDERKQAEIALRESEMRLRMLVESATEYAIFTIDEDRRVTSWNAGAERITGYAESDIVGRSADVLFTLEDRSSGQPALEVERARASGRTANDRWHVRRDGTLFFGSGSVELLNDPTGAIRGYVKIMRDNTERKRIEAERARSFAREQAARAEAEAANRAKDEFLAVVSHELRTPLNAILGWSQILLSQEISDPTEAKGLETIERNARAQSKLVEDILDVSRVISGSLRIAPREIELAPLVRIAVDAMGTEARRRGVELVGNVESNAGAVWGDPDRLQQILWNLLSNALKFTSSGGRVDVELRHVGESAQITVRDTGVGIDPAFVPHVFERFRQADASVTRRHGGLGLGLAIVRHLVELHGGSIAVSSPGRGSGATFTVTLPLAGDPDESLEERRTGGTTGAPRLDGVRVLVVEDEPDALGVLAALFERLGAQAVLVISADEGLAALEEGEVDVIVSDVGLPGEDGLSFLRAVRATERGRQTPAIALSAYTGDEDRRAARLAGFQSHLSKPVDTMQLALEIARLAKG